MKNEQFQEFSKIISRFIQKIIAMDRSEKGCRGVTLTQSYTINAIYENKTLSMNELSQKLGLATCTLTRITDVLVRDGIVLRNACQIDRRKVKICLSEKGENLAKDLRECNGQFWSKIFDTIPENKKELIVEDLTILLAALQNADKKCCS